MKENKFLILLILLFPFLLFSSCKTKEKGTFEIGKKTFLLNKKPFLVKAAELHYSRIPREYWDHRIKMCKAMGMNTICMYVFWNIHEQQMDQFNFEGQNDIAEFCRVAQQNGMYVIVRPGPYVCAEWEMGGLPWWLLKKEDVRVRSLDPFFIERTSKFIHKVGEQLADLQITRGGNVVMVQVENEFGAYGTDKEYISTIRDIVRSSGFTDVPLFQCDWSSNFMNNALDDLLWTVNFGTGANIKQQFKKLEEERPDTPLMCSEFWSGWFDHWGRKHETRNADAMVSGMKEMVDNHISFSLYMAHGGTTFGHWGGANSPAFSAMCSSYDYDAPISEAGWATDKFYKVRNLLKSYLPKDSILPEVPEAKKVIEVKPIHFVESAPLFTNLPKYIESKEIKPMELFDQGYGSIMYATTIPVDAKQSTLIINEPHDFTQVFLNGKRIATLDRRLAENTVHLPIIHSGDKLDILVEAMGRVNFGEAIHDRKGITKSVTLVSNQTTQQLENWKVYNIKDDYDTVANLSYTSDNYKVAKPAYYRASFSLDEVGDTFLDMSTWGKGLVWVNGICIGRFWEIGPQQTLYMPGCWLKKGKNEIIVFDILGPKEKTITGLKRPILDDLKVMKPRMHKKEGQNLKLKSYHSAFIGKFDQKSGPQDVDFGKVLKGRYLCLNVLSSYDKDKLASIAELYLLDKNNKPLSRIHWKALYASSEEYLWANSTADKIYDLQESTYWSNNRRDKFPHQIVIDLGEKVSFSGLRYIPRAEKKLPGMIKDFEIYIRDTDYKY